MRLERIKSLMLKAGFKSYDKLAEALEVKQNTVYRWVAGDREPSIEKLKEMARLFKTSVSYLIEEVDYSGPFSDISQNVKDNALTYLPVVGSSLSKDGKRLSIASYIPLPNDFIKDFAGKSGSSKVIKMSGDAMSPRYKDGDYLLYEETVDALSGDNIVAVYNKRTCVRGYFEEANGVVNLKAANSAYEDLIVLEKEKDSLLIQGVVKALIALPVRDGGFY